MDFALAAELWRQCVVYKLDAMVRSAEREMELEQDADTSQAEELHRQLENMQLQCSDLSRLNRPPQSQSGSENEEDGQASSSLLQLQQVPPILSDLKNVANSIQVRDVETRATLAQGHLKPKALPMSGLFDWQGKTPLNKAETEREWKRRQAQRTRAEFITQSAQTLSRTLISCFEKVQLVLADQNHLYGNYLKGLRDVFYDASTTLKQTIQLQLEWHHEAQKSLRRQWKNEQTRLVESYRQYAVQLVNWMRRQSRYEEGVVQLLELYEKNHSEIETLASTELLNAKKPPVSWQTLALADEIVIQSVEDLQLPLDESEEHQPDIAADDDPEHATPNATAVRKFIIDLSAHKTEFDEFCDTLTRSDTHRCIIGARGHIEELKTMTQQWRQLLWPVMYRLCATRYYVKRKQGALTEEFKVREQQSANVRQVIGKLRAREEQLLQQTLHAPSVGQIRKNTALQSEILKVLPEQQELVKQCRQLQKVLQRNLEYVNFSDLTASPTRDLTTFTVLETQLKQRATYIKQSFESKQLHIQQQVEGKLIKQLTDVNAFVVKKFNELEFNRQKYEMKIWVEWHKKWKTHEANVLLNEKHILQYHDQVSFIGEFAPELSKLSSCVHKITETFTQHIDNLRLQVQLYTIDTMLELCYSMLPKLEQAEQLPEFEQEQVEQEQEVALVESEEFEQHEF